MGEFMNSTANNKICPTDFGVNRREEKGRKRKRLSVEIVVVGFLTAVLLVSTSSASLTANVTFGFSGSIASSEGVSISPLHVNGNLIKNSSGHTVVLRGVNINEMADDPDGAWQGNWNVWHDADVQAELDAVANIGANVIRCIQSVDSWKYNLGPTSQDPSATHCSINNRDAVQRLLTFANERGLYVILTPWNVRNAYAGGKQDPLPYPPYQQSADASSIISSSQDFVDYWESVASVLKQYPNAIFELWNEPYGNQSSWFSVAQQCITAIRGTGAQNLIIFQWDYGCYVNLNANTGKNLQWVLDQPLNDPTGNLVYSTHIYRAWGAFQLYVNDVQTYAYNMADMQRAFNFFKLQQVATIHPLIIGEIGCYEDYTGTEAVHEKESFTNCLTLINQYGLSYCGWAWRTQIDFRLISNYSPTLTDGGQILKAAIISALNP
jgi:endoglucanase